MPINKFLRLSFISALLICLGGCASLFAREAGEVPDLTQIAKGADRSIIETELGTPLREVRAPIGSGAVIKAEYQYLIREDIPEDASRRENWANKMTGMHKQVVIIYYTNQNTVADYQRYIVH